MIKISLAKYNDYGASATIESNYDSFTVAEGFTYSARRACKNAANTLRKMADRFDLLADEEKPFNGSTQKRINRLKMRAYEPKTKPIRNNE